MIETLLTLLAAFGAVLVLLAFISVPGAGNRVMIWIGPAVMFGSAALLRWCA